MPSRLHSPAEPRSAKVAAPPLAWYGSSFAYYDEPDPAAQPVDPAEIARAERERRRAEFTPAQFGPEPGTAPSVGVVLGRFLPVHAGHQFLIEFARTFTPDLAVFVRVSASDPIPFALREAWLADLFPQVRVIAIEDAGDFPPEPGRRAQDIFAQRWADTIRGRLQPKYLFASEPYGPGLAGRLHARYVPVDPERRVVPISGTRLRAEPWAHWEFLPPCVRASYVRRVCVIGPESSGKTTLSRRLADHYRTTYVTEFARGILTSEGRDWLPSDTTTIAKAQQVGEAMMARRANRVLFCDTNLFAVGLWSERLFGQPPDWVRDANRSDPTDLYLLTAPDLPYVGSATYDEPQERLAFHSRCVGELTRLGRRFVHISGAADDRFAQAVDAVDALLRQPPAPTGPVA